MEKLIIRNFAGIKNIEIELNKINILLGPQASGKSIIAKLFFYFKSFFEVLKISIEGGKRKQTIDKEHLDRFIRYFPKESWANQNFEIEYRINNSKMFIIRKIGEPLKFVYSDDIKDMIRKSKKILQEEYDITKYSGRLLHNNISYNFSKKFYKLMKEKIADNTAFNQIFIPAGRSFFSNIQSSIFTLLDSNKLLDPFLIQFGSIYENFKRINISYLEKKKVNDEFNKLIYKILNSNYLQEKEKDYLLHKDKRKVNLSNASSGQQEILPLLLILKILNRRSFLGGGTVLYIEEPEAHLFPDAQKIVIKLLARIFNSNYSNFQIVVTTHSPYILSSFNNLMYAGYLKQKLYETDKLYSIIPEEEIVIPDNVFAYSLTNSGKIINIIDKETHLISQNIIDDVSNEISIEFGKLMDLEV